MAKIDNLMLKYRVQKRSADALTRIDPTANGKYLEWLFKMKFVKRNDKYYVNKDFSANYNVEIGRILRWMEKNSNNPKFKTEYKDINYFKTAKSLIDTMGPLCVPSKKEIKEQVDKVFEDDKWLIVVPKTFAASKLYGMNTKWCTTTKTYYNSYTSRGLLFYIIDKTHNVKFGVPVTTNGNNTTLTANSLTLYNNVDKGLKWNAIKDIYGNETMSKLLKPMNVYFKSIQLEKVKKRVLTDAIRTIGNVRTNVRKDDIFNTEDSNKLFNDLISKMTEILG
jgi:hypothetical protein